MLVLGIESSCDDTSVALLDCSNKGCFVVNEKTASQIDIHKKYGGVVPEIAGRMHAEKIVPLIESVLDLPPSPQGEGRGVRSVSRRPDLIAVTAGPGLMTGLIVGVEAARSLAYAWDIPLIAVNHIEGHIYSVEIPNPNIEIRNKLKSPNNIQYPISNIIFPALCLIVSGGHTELILMSDHGKYELLGATVDDAAGECFDKVAKLLGLPYPGGPEISRLAKDGNPNAIDFPRPMIKDESFDFSFAGLKTAALYWLRDHPGVIAKHSTRSTKSASSTVSLRGPAQAGPWQSPSSLGNHPYIVGDPHVSPKGLPRDDTRIEDFCASIEQAIVDVLVAKTIRAAKKYRPASVIVGGGVSANSKLRTMLTAELREQLSISNIQYPIPKYSMDNAAMIAVAGFYHARKKEYTNWQDIAADPNWRLA